MEISTNHKQLERKISSGFETVEFFNLSGFKEIVKYDHCCAILNGGNRKGENFTYSCILFGDIDNTTDNKCSIEEFKEIFKDKEYYLSTSKSHRIEKRDDGKIVPCDVDRFHVYFPLKEECWDSVAFKAALVSLIESYPFFDKAVNDTTRLFFGNPNDSFDVFYNDGDRWVIESSPEIPQNYTVQNDTQQTRKLSDDEILSDCSEIIRKSDPSSFPSYDDWINVGMAIKGAGLTLDLWLSVTYEKDRKVAPSKWAGFNGQKKIASLVSICQNLNPDFLRPGWLSKRNPSNGPARHIPGQLPKQEPKKVVDISTIDFDKRMEVKDFCRIDLGKKMIWDSSVPPVRIQVDYPLPTPRNFKYMLAHYGIVVRENLMNHNIEITVPGLAGEGKVQNAGRGLISGLCKINCLDILSLVDDWLIRIAHENKYHPVREWLEDGAEWDGINRYEILANSVKLNMFEFNLFSKLFGRFLISGIAALYEKQYRGRGVLTFQGKQSQGKTTFLRNLVPKEYQKDWFQEGLTFDSHNKDSIINSVTHWISELGELGSTFKRSDMDSLKAFLTKQHDTFRMPYEKTADTYERRSIFSASVNDTTFISDETGSSRFWIVPVLSFDNSVFDNLDMKQLWLQVKSWYDSGLEWWLSQEEEIELASCNEQFSEINEFQDSIFSTYKMSDKVLGDSYCFPVTLDQIALDLGYKNKLSKIEKNRLAKCLRKMEFSFKKRNDGNYFMMPRILSESEISTRGIDTKYENDAPF